MEVWTRIKNLRSNNRIKTVATESLSGWSRVRRFRFKQIFALKQKEAKWDLFRFLFERSSEKTDPCFASYRIRFSLWQSYFHFEVRGKNNTFFASKEKTLLLPIFRFASKQNFFASLLTSLYDVWTTLLPKILFIITETISLFSGTYSRLPKEWNITAQFGVFWGSTNCWVKIVMISKDRNPKTAAHPRLN